MRTSGDFGVPGELPSHPELLDWLAIEFRDTMQWDMKRFYKLMFCQPLIVKQRSLPPRNNSLIHKIAGYRVARASVWMPK